MKSRWLSIFVVLALAVVGLTANVALAQTTGDIDGTVTDSNNAPLPGASVTIASPSLQGTRTAVTDGAGRFRFPALPGGTYVVTVALSGFTKAEKRNVTVSIGGTASVPVQLSVSVKEEVVVTGEAPVIDTAKTTIGVTGTSEQISRLPLARNFTSVATTAPGTGTDNSGGITFYGATGLENQYIIDGVNTTGIKIGNQGKTLTNEFVQEVEVKSGGYEAEFGRALGGTINVVTKSGGNEFHGDVFGYYDSDSLAASNDHVDDRVAIGQTQLILPTRSDFGADLGGYFLKDRLWFFAAYNRVNRDQDYVRNTGIFFLPNNNLDTSKGTGGFSTAEGTDETRTNLYSGKLTFRLGEAHTLSASVFGDPGEFNGRISTQIGPDSAVLGTTKSGGTDIAAKYDGIFGTSFLLSGQYTHHQEKNENISPYENQLAIWNYRGGRTYIASGGGLGPLTNEEYKRDDYKLVGSFFAGAHEIKVGGEYEKIGSSFSEKYYGGARVLNYLLGANGAYSYSYQRYFAKAPLNCQATYDASGTLITGNFGTPNSAAALAACAGFQPAASVDNPPTTKNLAIFAQDSWKVLRNLTLNVGIRYEEQELLDASGATAIKIDGEWSPRIGVIWDPLNNGRSKVYASVGRYYSTIPQDIQTRALGNEYSIFAYNYSQGQFNPITDYAYFGYQTLQGGELTQTDLKGMYQDEAIAGIEYEVFKGWSFGVKGIYKKLGRVIEDRCDLLDPRVGLGSYLPPGATTTCALINPGDDSALQVIKDPTNPACQGSFATTGVLDGNCESINPSRYYRGVELTATHRFSNNFYLLASYIYSSLQGNYSGNFSQTRETGQSDPNINADFDYIDMTPNNYGTLRNNRTNQFKVTGTYAFPFGLVTSLNALYTDGRAMSVRGYARPGYTQERYYIARGSFDTLPSTYNVDLHLEWGIRLGAVTLTPILDVFNLTNFQGTTSRDEVFCTSTATCNLVLASTGKQRKEGPYTTANSSNPNFNRDIAWVAPRLIRLGARVSF